MQFGVELLKFTVVQQGQLLIFPRRLLLFFKITEILDLIYNRSFKFLH